MPQRYDAIIIGGGHNGLVTAAYLARAGRKTLILERRELVGGCAVTEEIWPGYRVSTASYLTQPSAGAHHPRSRSAAIRIQGRRQRSRLLLALSRWPAASSCGRTGRRTLEEIAKFSKHDAEVYPAFEAQLERLSQVVESLLLTTPPQFPPRGVGDLIEYLKLTGRLRKLAPADMVALVKIFTQSAAELLDEWFESEEVRVTLGHRWRHRRERRPALPRDRVHPDASRHGQRGGSPRIMGLRARRHGRRI
jgi:phytoene dehydrogenase-like protein